MSEPRANVAGPQQIAGVDRTLVRPRLDGIVDGARIVVAHGPAGSGKTTFLAHHAERWTGRVAWLECDSLDRDPNGFFSRLLAAVSAEGGAERIEELDATLIVIDEVDRLAESDAHTVLDAVVARLPENCAIAFGTRRLDVLPGLERWRMSHQLGQVSSNDLRFRLWEVDWLFRLCFGHELAVKEVHQVSSASGGWAVALRYCGVALRQAAPEDRAHLITSLGRSRAQLRRYLRTQVLSTMTSEQRRALRRLAVFDRLDERRVDALAPELAGQLSDLVSTGVLDESGPDGMVRMHSLLRAELLEELINERADARMTDLYLEAAAVLERLGQAHEANVARSRARGPVGADDSIDELAMHAAANQALLAGDIHTARAGLQAAIERFEEQGGSSVARRQLQHVDAWLGAPGGTPTTWVAAVRQALEGDRFEWTGDNRSVVSAVRAFVGGDFQSARRHFADAEHGSPDGLVRLVAGLGAGAASLVLGDRDDAVRCGRRTWERCCDDGRDALALIAEALMLAADGSSADIGTIRSMAAEREDVSLRAFVTLIAAEATATAPPERSTLLTEAADDFNRLGMRALGGAVETLAARQRSPDRVAAPTVDVAGTAAPAPAHAPSDRATPSGRRDTFHARCLGDLEVWVDGRLLDDDVLRPLHRELLAILCSRAGAGTHGEELADLLWPDRSFDEAKHNLHTAISALRTWFADNADPLGRGRIVRRGGAYTLVADELDTDLGQFSSTCHRLTRELRTAEADLADVEALLDGYGDEPFRSFGPTDWAVAVRSSVRADIDGLLRAVESIAHDDHEVELASSLRLRVEAVRSIEVR